MLRAGTIRRNRSARSPTRSVGPFLSSSARAITFEQPAELAGELVPGAVARWRVEDRDTSGTSDASLTVVSPADGEPLASSAASRRSVVVKRARRWAGLAASASGEESGPLRQMRTGA